MSESPRLISRQAPAHHAVVRPYEILRSERCINCGTCVEACVYGCHQRRAAEPRKMDDPEDACCRNCFACVLYCPRQALSMRSCEAYHQQGDSTYTADDIRAIQEQAADGHIPVSGSGYGGPFDGPGYDGIWTDMSEIVRPTRDGIHGREHISTEVNLGRKISDLCGMYLDDSGSLQAQIPPTRQISMPVLFGMLPFQPSEEVLTSLALAASKLTTYTTIRAADGPERFREYFNHLVVRLAPGDVERHADVVEWATIIELDPGDDQIGAIHRARQINPHLLTIVRVPVSKEASRTVAELAAGGGETIHLSADIHGRGEDGTSLLDSLRETHRALVERGLRDRITLIASGGVARAEHVPKTILLGADAVAVDVPLLIALECVVCGKCQDNGPCPREVGMVDPRWGATRVINLMISWRDQLLEVLGAMGLRDVRRLRGELGRAIFADEARADYLQRLGRPAVVDQVQAEPSDPRPKEEPWGEPAHAPHRFAVRLGAFLVDVDRGRCIHCGACVETCRVRVHRRLDGKLSLEEPLHARCIGPTCQDNDWCCVPRCPADALSVRRDPVHEVLGDRRWTPGLLLSTFDQAETGEAPRPGVDDLIGDSGGGLDTLRLAEPLAEHTTAP